MDLPGARSGSGEKHLRCRAVGILFEEMVLVGPHVIEAELIGDLDLGQRLVNQPVFGTIVPGTWELKFVEQTEPHGTFLSRKRGDQLCKAVGAPSTVSAAAWRPGASVL